MKDKKQLSSIKTVSLLFLIGGLLLVFVFPEVFLKRTISFLTWDDYLVNYLSTFCLTNFFYQGGIQIWDFFGQLPHTYFWMTFGMFHLPNVLTALAYYGLSPLANNSAEFFNQVFAFVNIGTLFGIKIAGIFLLLKQFTEDRWVLKGGTIVLAVFFAAPSFVFGTFYQSFYPLLMYFILRYFESTRLRFLGMGILFMIISFSQGIIHSCYMYLGINLFILSCAAHAYFLHQVSLNKIRTYILKNNLKIKWAGLILALIALIILGPYIYMQFFSLKDIAFGQTHDRMTGMWRLFHYFNELFIDAYPPWDFFPRMLDFTYAVGRSFFLGVAVFALSGLAIIMSKDRRKWIFVLTIIGLWFLNFPRDVFSIGLIGHWINALTNPLKVMVRSYLTAIDSMMPYLFMPLVFMGLGVIKNIFNGMSVSKVRVLIYSVFLIGLAFLGSKGQIDYVKGYIIFDTSIFLAAFLLLVSLPRSSKHKVWLMLVFGALIIIDIFLSTWSMKKYISQTTLRPHFLEALPAVAGPVSLDFHNPKIFPFVAESDIYPDVGNTYLLAVKEISSNFHAVVNRQTAFMPIDSHSPRHVAFKNWVNDPLMKGYLSQNSKLFFFAPYGVKASSGNFESMVNRHLALNVVVVDGQDKSLLPDIPDHIKSFEANNEQWVIDNEDIKDGIAGWEYRENEVIWNFPVKFSLPSYLASNIATHDRWVRFFIQSPDQKYIELAPTQGQLLRPWTFDVQNIKEGKVFVALPINTSFVGYKGVLLIKTLNNSGITEIWCHKHDDTGITFNAPADGWLGIGYPYDQKWHIEIDGHTQQFYRANKSFMAVPITQGRHRIYIQYWPKAWLRFFLPLSIFISSVLFIGLIFYALFNEDTITPDHESKKP